MSYAPHPAIRMAPVEVAPETFLLRSAQAAFGAPLSVNLNSMVIRGEQPVIIDTSTKANREHFLADLTELVDPADVRWIVLSHDDEDHVGNLAEVLDLCPNATLAASWAILERSGSAISLPTDRMRWLDDGGKLDVGDRVLLAQRPPVYDSPTTRAIYDGSTGMLWASDAFATPMPSEPVEEVAELPPPMWAEGMAMFQHHALSPWLRLVDKKAFAGEVSRFKGLGAQVICSAHSPIIRSGSIEAAFDHLASMPDVVPPPHPDQAALEAAMAGGAP